MRILASFLILLSISEVGGENITSLGQTPDWSKLDAFQNKCSVENFRSELEGVYCPRKSWWSPWIKFENNQIRIRKSAGTEDWYVLNCKRDSNQSRKMENQLSNIKIIALDPGHIGGDYAEMEGRNFQIGTDPFVREGDLSLRVAKRLKSLLQGKGFEAILVRNQLQPVTSARPDDFERSVQNWIIDRNLTGLPEKKLQELKNKRRELLFYRVSEIRARAKLIATEIQPDLTVCLHLNAAPWKDPNQKKLLDRNDYHVLVNGCFMGGELAYDDQRFEMVFRLLNSWHQTERHFAERINQCFSTETGLPAFSYKGPNALKIGDIPGVWARNLLANRIYPGPVIFMEPYIANSKTEYQRIQMGDYQGRKNFGGTQRLALVEEYAQCVLKGIMNSTGRK